MDIDKLVYEIIEDVSAVSDDRYLDERYVQQKIDTCRADLVRKKLFASPGHSTIGLEQDFPVTIESVSRSLFPGLTLPCNILRSSVPVPNLIYGHSLSNYYRVRTIEILRNTIEVIERTRANFVVFEFPVVYAFLDAGNHLFFLAPDNSQELKKAVLTGVFEEPLVADPTLKDYPLNASDWKSLKPIIIQEILQRPGEDPINNSETDYDTQRQRRPQAKRAT